MSESSHALQANAPPERLAPLDALRGAIMIVMALDHANLFIAHQHPRPEIWNGLLPTYTTALAFLTRFVTHFAAPGFFFLLGAGVTLFADARRQVGWTWSAVVRHLILRGGLLIVLQFLIEDPAWPIASAGRPLLPGLEEPVYFGVLYALGVTLIASALLLCSRSRGLIGLSLAAVLLTQALFPVYIRSVPPSSLWLQVLLIPGNTADLSILYPPIPWLGLTLFGVVFGRWLLADRARTYRRAAVIGGAFIASFFVVRALDGFGNIRSVEGANWIAFFNVVKYPPSLVFLLITLGVDLLLLALCVPVERFVARWGKPLLVFGANPLFFYLAHLYLYAVLGRLFFPRGASLPVLYAMWLTGLLILYPLCWAFGRFKRRQPLPSIWRFF